MSICKGTIRENEKIMYSVELKYSNKLESNRHIFSSSLNNNMSIDKLNNQNEAEKEIKRSLTNKLSLQAPIKKFLEFNHDSTTFGDNKNIARESDIEIDMSSYPKKFIDEDCTQK